MSETKCQRCESTRIADVNAKCSDACNWRGDGVDNENGYVPSNVGIGGGDYLEIVYCLDCGQIQGEFPISAEPARNLQIEALDQEIDWMHAKLTQNLRDDYRERITAELKEAEKKLEGLRQ